MNLLNPSLFRSQLTYCFETAYSLTTLTTLHEWISLWPAFIISKSINILFRNCILVNHPYNTTWVDLTLTSIFKFKWNCSEIDSLRKPYSLSGQSLSTLMSPLLYLEIYSLQTWGLCLTRLQFQTYCRGTWYTVWSSW